MSNCTLRDARLPAIATLLALTGWFAHATDIVINNTDPPGSGFNDPTPAAPVGGNPGTTIGEQRLHAFEFAASLWGVIVLGNEEIVVRASFSPLNCTAGSAVLGAASAREIFANFSGAPLSEVWYPAALANASHGGDLSPDEEDIQASFNGGIDNNDSCLSGRNWYYGLDNDPPGNDIDFLNVIMHELGHGLGFASVVNLGTGALPSNRPGAYELYALDTQQMLHLSEMTDSQRRDAIDANGKLVWDGPLTTARAADYLAAGRDANGFVRLYAPTTVAPGSSVSHFDSVASPNLLMEPALSSSLEAVVNVDLTANFMADIGWEVPDTDGDLVTDINDNCVIAANPLQIDADGDRFGNACDADIDNNAIVNVVDLGIFKQRFFGSDPVADFNGDGIVNAVDLGFLKASFFRAPGPSGLYVP